MAKLAAIAKRRALRKEEHQRLMMNLAKMRMICDSVHILDPEARECPKLDELRSILEDCLTEPEVKVIIFSEWIRMLDLVQVCSRNEGRLRHPHRQDQPEAPSRRNHGLQARPRNAACCSAPKAAAPD